MKKINLPTKITLARIGIALLTDIAIIVFFFLDENGVFLISNCNFKIFNAELNYFMIIIFALFLLASVTDSIDGRLARKNNQVTDLGKFLDPLADKILINSIMIFLTFGFKSLEGYHTYPWFCVILMVIRDLVVDGIRLVSAKKNIVVAANGLGKAKTVLQIVSIAFVLLNGFPFSLFDSSFPKYLSITDFHCYLATIVSLVSGIKYVFDNKKALE